MTLSVFPALLFVLVSVPSATATEGIKLSDIPPIP